MTVPNSKFKDVQLNQQCGPSFPMQYLKRADFFLCFHIYGIHFLLTVSKGSL